MKVTIINGSPRKGNTYAVTQLFKNQMLKHADIEFTEFFLPQDMPEFCKGCYSCFTNGESTCPHFKYTKPVLDSKLEADALIINTPVYVLRESGAIKSFLDHYGFIFLVHRARPEMFSKKAFILSTTAGAGTGQAIKAIKTSLQFWGINRVYSTGFALWGDWDNMPAKRHIRFEKRIKNKAQEFYREVASKKEHVPYIKTRFFFHMAR